MEKSQANVMLGTGKLKGKLAFITCGNSCIGLRTAERFAADGANRSSPAAVKMSWMPRSNRSAIRLVWALQVP